MLLETLSQRFRKARTTSTTDSSYPARTPTNTMPSGTGNNASQTTASSVFEVGGTIGSVGQNAVLAVFYGAGSDDNTFSCRFLGWRQLLPEDPSTTIWVPVTLCEVQVTLGTTTGTAGLVLLNTDRLCDIITLTTGNADVSVDVVSPADNTVASIVVDMKGCQLLEPIFTTGSSATNCNALLAMY
jgi:hypothetical protein